MFGNSLTHPPRDTSWADLLRVDLGFLGAVSALLRCHTLHPRCEDPQQQPFTAVYLFESMLNGEYLGAVQSARLRQVV